MSIAITCAALIGVALIIKSPFLLWRSYLVVLWECIRDKHVTVVQKLSMLRHLIIEVVLQPVLSALWLIDGFVSHTGDPSSDPAPVFIISQPRSGTTFLLRTLSKDDEHFFSLKHIEWRYPFAFVWRLIDLFGLRARLESIDYWPNTELGQLASRIHHHKLGSVEEHGIFFEERMYHHYFTFRRFPFLGVLHRVRQVAQLRPGERRKLLATFQEVVRKAENYRGKGRIWLTKENESVDAYRLLSGAFPNARFIVIVRPPQEFVNSYVTMSYTCTTAKHGVNPDAIPGWFDANMAFRVEECRKLEEFCRELSKTRSVHFLTFGDFTRQISSTVDEIYKFLGLKMSDRFRSYLDAEQRKQDSRVAGYDNRPQSIQGFGSFERFVDMIDRRNLNASSEISQ